MKAALSFLRIRDPALNQIFVIAGLLAFVIAGYGVSGERNEKGETAAFLLDIEGQVKIMRQKSQKRIPVNGRSCVPLNRKDVVLIPKDGKASVVTPTGAYSLSGKGRYQLLAEKVTQVDGDKRSPLRPTIGVRGNSDPRVTLREKDVVMPPPKLLAAVTPPVQRAAEGAVTVMSPRGKTLTRKPKFIWTGDENDTYQLTIVELNPKGQPARTFDFVNVQGCQIAWEKTQWPKLKRGHHYMVVIQRDGERLTTPDATFQILTDVEAKVLNQRLSSIEKGFGTGDAATMIRANVLMNQRWGCYAEARRLAVRLVKSNPKNIPYLKHLQHCYKALGMPGGVKAVSKTIEKLRHKDK